MEQEGITKELLAKQLEEYRRALDPYFSPKYRGLVGGVHLMPDNVRAAVDGADEYFKCDFDNKTLLFLYDDEHDGEEELLANYIKYIAQQILNELMIYAYYPAHSTNDLKVVDEDDIKAVCEQYINTGGKNER